MATFFKLDTRAKISSSLSSSSYEIPNSKIIVDYLNESRKSTHPCNQSGVVVQNFAQLVHQAIDDCTPHDVALRVDRAVLRAEDFQCFRAVFKYLSLRMSFNDVLNQAE